MENRFDPVYIRQRIAVLPKVEHINPFVAVTVDQVTDADIYAFTVQPRRIVIKFLVNNFRLELAYAHFFGKGIAAIDKKAFGFG